MAEYDGLSQYRKSAPRRLRDAEELLQPPRLDPQEQGANQRHLRAAIYLAGHALECLLKAYIVGRQPPSLTLSDAVAARRAVGEQIPNILGAEGHCLTTLLSLTDLEVTLQNTEERQQDWAICVKWKSTWRYDPQPPAVADAQEFVQSARRIYQWVQNQL